MWDTGVAGFENGAVQRGLSIIRVDYVVPDVIVSLESKVPPCSNLHYLVFP